MQEELGYYFSLLNYTDGIDRYFDSRERGMFLAL